MRQFVYMRRAIAAALVVASPCDASRAETALDHWRFGASNDGLVTATLHAVNKLVTSGGAMSYSPTLTIACRAEDEPRWSEWLQLNDPVSATRSITLSVTIDQAGRFTESWAVGYRGKKLIRDGADGIHRLLAADRLLLTWRFGLLAGQGEADFDLAGIAEAVRRIAESCKTDPP